MFQLQGQLPDMHIVLASCLTPLQTSWVTLRKGRRETVVWVCAPCASLGEHSPAEILSPLRDISSTLKLFCNTDNSGAHYCKL